MPDAKSSATPLARRRSADSLRSARWFAPDDLRAFGHRSRLMQMGYGPDDWAGRPVIGILNTWSDINPCHAHFKQRVEDACNVAVRLNRQIDVRVLPREQALAIPNIIRTASDLLPPDIEMVRIVDINGIDMQADGGTHVASTAMIGRIAVTKMESKGRGFRRLRIRIEDAE